MHEDAINLYSLCAADAPEHVRGVDIAKLHETCANALLQKGDFDKAVKHYIDGNTEFVTVIRRFPDLVPQSMHAMFNVQGQGQGQQGSKAGGSGGGATSGGGMTGQVLQRAATAVVHFCDFHRPKVKFEF